MPKISIIIPFYQAEKTLANTIRSVVDQTFSDWELLLVDDGSTDGGTIIAENWKSKDSRILLFKEINEGRSMARNLGIMHATGDWITFLDADDKLDNEALAILMEGTTDGELVCGGYNSTSIDYSVLEKNTITAVDFIKILVSPKIKENLQFVDSAFDGLFERTVWGKLYRLDAVKENEVWFEKGLELGEDALFNMVYAKNIQRIVLMNKRTYFYNRENEGTVRCYKKKQADSLIELIHASEKLFREFIENGIISNDEANGYYVRQFRDLFIRMVDYEKSYLLSGKDLIEIAQDPIIIKALRNHKGSTFFATFSFKIYGFLSRYGCGKYALAAESALQKIYKRIHSL